MARLWSLDVRQNVLPLGPDRVAAGEQVEPLIVRRRAIERGYTPHENHRQ